LRTDVIKATTARREREDKPVKPTLIVCAVEFSPEGRAVLAMALRLARWYAAELHVAHLGSRVRSQNKTGAARTVDHELSARFDDFMAAVSAEGIKLETVILQGDPVSAVVDYTRSVSGELILVSQHGRRGSPYWSAGTFGKEVARGADCPTITVPGHSASKAGADAPFKNIVCGIDSSESSALALREALAIAQQSNARLTLLHVVERARHEVHNLRMKLKALVPAGPANAGDVDVDIQPGTPRDVILATAAARGADLIVIGQPRTTSHQIVMASTAGAVLRRARCPVLIVPEDPISEDIASRSIARTTNAACS
jgi:nucleotide-binding universal stress UspA family protein